ncbi:MAG: restriction endonuclease subunit S [Nostoc sp. DedVER02]|uniref:restriction endonuclease subunit S n=1 Tax=unclassified Nostoc TaxID=2593658 RepID=UPI002AD2D51C|nr:MULTISPECIES: restriction endonuclease subunit S [unclassified Nostoc]MDZ7985192.1 restriction endonuclease subunit S [Nostoc sp. DedVER02]MDZ8115130.1 restriction endonuclease subunit S [Nostoc sp. DedVER01b]
MALSLKPIEIVEKNEYPLLVKAPHWERVYLKEVAEVQNGFAFKSNLFSKNKGIPLIRIRDINNKSTESYYIGEYDEEYLINKGDILIGMDGDFNAAIWKGEQGLLNQRICRVRCFSALYSDKFLFLCLQPYLDAINAETSSVTVKHLSSQTVEDIPLPLPPIEEQNRIVAKIEELFSELDKGVEYLKTAQEQLKVYRQSVLKYAFEGKLTKQWREAHVDQLETADRLLERIQQERENLYQQQLNEWEEAVKTWEDNGKQGKKPNQPRAPFEITPLTEEELLQLPQLPEGWCWTRVDALGEVQLGRQRSPQNRSRDYPTKYIRAANITKDGFDLTDVMDMEFKPHELERYQLKYGDILLSEASGSPDQAGKPALWRDQIPNCCFQNTVIRFQPIYLSSEYMLNVFKHFYFNKIFSKIASGVGINHLSASKFSVLPVPLAPLEEQQYITPFIELNFSIYNQLETIINETLQQSKLLRNSILKNAFYGQLVPQDSRDENAAVLLEKIKENRRHREENQVYLPKTRKKTAMKKDLSITEVLQELHGLATAQDVWQRSKYHENIEEFYAELKEQINNGAVEEAKELREERKSYLRLINEN